VVTVGDQMGVTDEILHRGKQLIKKKFPDYTGRTCSEYCCIVVTNVDGFPGFTVEHFRVKFGGPGCIGFGDIVRQTDRQTRKFR